MYGLAVAGSTKGAAMQEPCSTSPDLLTKRHQVAPEREFALRYGLQVGAQHRRTPGAQHDIACCGGR